MFVLTILFGSLLLKVMKLYLDIDIGDAEAWRTATAEHERAQAFLSTCGAQVRVVCSQVAPLCAILMVVKLEPFNHSMCTCMVHACSGAAPRMRACMHTIQHGGAATKALVRSQCWCDLHHTQNTTHMNMSRTAQIAMHVVWHLCGLV